MGRSKQQSSDSSVSDAVSKVADQVSAQVREVSKKEDKGMPLRHFQVTGCFKSKSRDTGVW